MSSQTENVPYNHFMKTDPDMRDFLGPIEQEDDPVTGMVAKFRYAKIAMMRGSKAKKDVKVYLGFDDKKYVPHIRTTTNKQLEGWYQDKGEAKGGSRERPCMTDAMLAEPYGGFCTVGCVFCYINSGQKGYRGSGLTTVPLGYGENIKKQLSKIKTSGAGYFSSNTDPFQPIEEVYHNTQAGAQAFTDAGLPIFFLSRLPYPSWAIDMLRKNPFSYAQKSISTSNALDWEKLSPGSMPLGDHIEQIRELRAAGIYVSVQVNPIIPGVTSIEEILELFDMLAEVGANHVIVKFVEAGYAWKAAMVERVTERFGKVRGGKFNDLFTDNMGGQRCIDEEWRLNAHEILQKYATKVGLTYSTCYEYKYVDRAEDGKLLSKKTRSIGPDFLTGEQCHGQRVPMHTRMSLDAPFLPVSECPPSGCLACGNDNEGSRGSCGSLLFGAAKGNRMKDFKISVYDKDGKP